jgi:phosphoglycerate dehydrogenase-like enzyme
MFLDISHLAGANILTQNSGSGLRIRDAVAVASHSFSKNATLRDELTARYPVAHFNETGRPLAGSDLIDFLGGHPLAITGLEVLDAPLFEVLHGLRLVSKYGVGLDTIDLDAARRHHVTIRWTPGVNRQAVAELTVGLMIALSRNVLPLAADVRAGDWPHDRGGRQLSSALVGILGCGNVGQQVARICRAFGATILAHDILRYEEFYREFDVRAVSLDELLERSDFMTIHLPLDRSTRSLIGDPELNRMKASAYVVNTARGGIVDEQALRRALVERRLAGAAFDVFTTEPPADPLLLGLRNFIATPHIGGGTEEAVLAMGRAAIEGLDEAPGTVDLTAPKF